jgi:hypothetical protein
MIAADIGRAVALGSIPVAAWLGRVGAGVGTLILPLASGAGLLALTLLVAQQVIGDGGATAYLVDQASLRQMVAPDQLLGRINAGTRFTGLGATLLGTLAGGVLGQTAGYRPTLLLGAIATFGGR